MPVRNDSRTIFPSRSLRWLCALGLVLFVAAAAHGQTAPVPKTPASALDVIEIHPFKLREGYRYDWLASRPSVSEGLLVVLKVGPEYVVPRNAAEPVLYAGDLTVQRLSQGDRSGYVVGIVPGKVSLENALVFFGRPELPERVDAEIVAREREIALASGIKPFTREQIERALRDEVNAENLSALLRGKAGDLVTKYSPDEKDLAETWRLPSAGSR